MNRLSKIILTSSLLLAAISALRAYNPQFDHLTSHNIKNYLPRDFNGQPDNFAAIESNQGIMYFGNLWGIIEFDGYEWRNIYFPNGSSGISFAKNTKGTIFCGGRSEFGFLARDASGQFQYNSLIHLMPHEVNFSDVWATHYIDSSIVFCSFEALFIFNGNSIKIIKANTNFDRAYEAHGKLYVREAGLGLLKLENEKLVLVEGGDLFAESGTLAILPYKKGQLIIASSNGFQIYNGKNTRAWRTDADSFLSGSKIHTAIPLPDSSYILATTTKGVAVIDSSGQIQYIFDKGNGLISNNILNIYKDSFGNLWILSRGGISKVEFSGCFRYINDYKGVTGIVYVSDIYNNKLFLGTSEGLYYHRLEPTVSTGANAVLFTKVPIIKGNVWALHQFNNELFCGHDDGVFVINDQRSYHIPGTKGVWCFVKPKGIDNIILAGTYNGIIVLEKQLHTWELRGYVKGFGISSRFFVQDALEDFWVSHGNKGLFRLTLSHNLDTVLKIKLFGSADGINTIYNNTVYKHCNTVIATNNLGVFKYNYKNEQFEPWVAINNALGNYNMIQRFVKESENSYWVILNDEQILNIIKSDSGLFKTPIFFRKFKKLLAGSFEYLSPLNRNIILISTLDGLAFFDREKYFDVYNMYKKHFKTFIRRAELTNDTNYSAINIWGYNNKRKDSITRLKHNQNSIRFTFGSNCFNDIELTKYQFCLLGFDKTWSPWLTAHQKEYTNLPPGHYKFYVRAINSLNITSKEYFWEFVILPPWYKTVFARLGFFIFISLLVFGVYKFILFRFRLLKKRLELKKARELWHLNKKHTEEQIQKENEILKLNNEKLSAEIASLEQLEEIRKKDEQLKEELEKSKQEQSLHEQEKYNMEITYKNKELSFLAMQIAHKNESLTKIREYLTEFSNKNYSPDFKLLINNLFQFIEKDSQRDKEWKEFQEHFEIVHSSFLNRIKAAYPAISPTLLKLSTYLRLKMTNKQIARIMNTTVESVLKSRYRLREKLQLKVDESLDEFIENF